MKNNTINAWQTGILIFVLLFANKILILPSLLYEQAGIFSFTSLFVLFALEFLLIYFCYLLKKKFPTQSFSYLLKTYCGTFWKNLINFLFMAFFLGKTVLLYNVTYIFFVNTVYKDGSNILFLICFLPVIVYLAIVGIRVMCRTLQIFFPIIIAIVVLCVIVGIFGINEIPLISLKPFGDYLSVFFKHFSAFGDSIILFLFMDKININKKQWKIVFSFASISAILVCAICITFIFSFTYTSYMHPFALFEIMSYIKEYGGVGRVDIISMIVLIIFTYFQLAIYLLAFLESYRQIFKAKELYAVITFVILFLLLMNFFVLNLEKAILFGENSWPFFAGLSFIIIPIFVFIMFFKSEVKKE